MTRTRRRLRAAGSAAALAALTGGLPALLYIAGGSPVPHAVPSWPQVLAALARPENPGVLLGAVRAVSWAAWAAFTACVLAQALAVARGRGTWRLPGAGPLQRLAAALVTTALIGATAAPGSAQAAPSRPARVTAAAPPSPGLPPAAAVTVPGQRGAYRVRPGDNLWDIAADHLGDGEAWHQIWALNKGRPQPGGGALTRPALIQPGWILRLPPPASGPLSPRPVPGPPRPASPLPARSPVPPARNAPGGAHHARHQGSGGISLPSGGLAGVTLALAVTAALALAAGHRRRRYRPARALTSRLGPAVPPAPPVITALRRAATAPQPGSDPGYGDDPGSDPYGPVPGEAPSWPAPDAVPLPGPPETAPHPPWPPGTTRTAPPPRTPAPPRPYSQAPGEVALGVRDGREVTVDLDALGGLGLTGPGASAAARAVLAAVLSQALPGSPAGPADVIMTADAAAALLPGSDLRGAVLPGLTLAPSLDAALSRAEEIIVRRARMTAPDDDVHDHGGPGGLPPAVLIAVPGQPASARLRAVLQAGCGTGTAGILLGDWPAGTTGHVAADGVLACADPGLDGTLLFHLAAADTTAVLAVLRDACGPPPARPAPAAPRAPLAAPPAPKAARPAPARQPATAPPAGPPPRSTWAPAPAGTAPVTATPAPPAGRLIRVEVLGPLRITAAGTEIRGGLRKARELAAYLAVHPDGATSDAITEALWPGSRHGPAQRALALRRLRDLLRTAAGVTEPLLVLLSGGRYRLDPSLVSTDYADFQAALDDARTAADDRARLAACRRAAGLYRGPLADGAGYDWAEPWAETARRRALDACARIAQILGPDNPDEALAALEKALGHDPYNEWVYQAIMRLQAGAGRPDAVRRTLSLLEARLADLGVTPGAQTRQLAAALLLGPPAGRGRGPAA